MSEEIFDVVNEQARVDVPRPFTATGLFDHNRNQEILHISNPYSIHGST